MKNQRIQTMMQVAGRAAGNNTNQKILGTWKATTGAKVFKTAKQWKQQGKYIRRGEKGYPVFSEPIIRQETQRTQYSICFLFHEGQLK